MKPSSSPLVQFIGIEFGAETRTVLVRFDALSSKAFVVAAVRSQHSDISREQLISASQQVNGKDLRWVLLLNRGEYQLSRVDQPSVAESEFEKSLRWLVPFKEVDPKDASISWVTVPKGSDDRQQLYVAACSQAMVEARGALFRSAKLQLSAVDIHEMAQRNIATRIPARGAICLLFAEPAGVQVTITLGQDLYLERFIREPLLDSNESDVSQIKRTGIEIRRSIEFVRNSNPDLAAIEIYLGPTPTETGLAQQLSAELGQPVKSLDLGTVFNWPAGSPLANRKTQAEFFSVLGACLRL